MEYCFAVKTIKSADKLMELGWGWERGNILSEVTQVQKDKYVVYSLICGYKLLSQ